ncbi:uncharacterized protein LOC113796882 [Dermatophagoides pteronyssinus]|uniref:uncharacterized protein LOC113796882 n=1 Tax=Dermatophagoides pteronyssinus TaxID=6956 RepID=UPI003F664DBF
MLISYITIYLWIINLGNNPVQVADANLLLVATSLFEKLRTKTSKLSNTWLSDQQKRFNYFNHRQSKSLKTIPIPLFSDQAIFGTPIIPPIEIPVFEPIRNPDNNDNNGYDYGKDNRQQQQQQQQKIITDLQMSESTLPILSNYYYPPPSPLPSTTNELSLPTTSNQLFQLTLPLYIPEDFPSISTSSTLLLNTDQSNFGSSGINNNGGITSSSGINDSNDISSYEPFVPFENIINNNNDNPIIMAESSFQSPKIQYSSPSLLSSSTLFNEPISLTRFILFDQLLRDAIQLKQQQQQNDESNKNLINMKQKSNHFILNTPKEIFLTSENRNQKKIQRPFWLDIVQPRLRNTIISPSTTTLNIPSYHPFYWNDLNMFQSSSIPSSFDESSMEINRLKNNQPKVDLNKNNDETTTTTTNWPYNSRYEPEQILNNDKIDDDEEDEDNDDGNDGNDRIESVNKNNNTNTRFDNDMGIIMERKIEPNFFNFSDWKPPILKTIEMNNDNDEILMIPKPEQLKQQPRESRTMDFKPLIFDIQQPSSSHLNPIRIRNHSINDNVDMLPLENKILYNDEADDNDPSSSASASDMKQEGKNEHYADKGHFKHGWKNVYHKEEWGEANKYHDIWRYKDWKNRYYNQKEQNSTNNEKLVNNNNHNHNNNESDDDDDDNTNEDADGN